MFIITDKLKLSGGGGKGVGVMKDEEVKLEEIETSHTLPPTHFFESSCTFVYYGSIK